MTRTDFYRLTMMIMIVVTAFVLAKGVYHLREIHVLLLKQENRELKKEINSYK